MQRRGIKNEQFAKLANLLCLILLVSLIPILKIAVVASMQMTEIKKRLRSLGKEFSSRCLISL